MKTSKTQGKSIQSWINSNEHQKHNVNQFKVESMKKYLKHKVNPFKVEPIQMGIRNTKANPNKFEAISLI